VAKVQHFSGKADNDLNQRLIYKT